MQKKATFSPVDPLKQVITRTLSVTDAVGTILYAIAPDQNEYQFEVSPSPGDTGSCFLIDTNAVGPSLSSNVFDFPLTPVPPPLTPPEPPVIESVVDVPDAPQFGKHKGKPAGFSGGGSSGSGKKFRA